MLKSLVLLNFKRNDDVKWVSFDFMTTCALKLGTIKLVQIFPGDLNQRVESCSLKPINYLKVFTVCEGALPVLGLRMWVGKSKVKLRVLWLTEVWSHAPINGDHSSPRPAPSECQGRQMQRDMQSGRCNFTFKKLWSYDLSSAAH